MKFNLDMFCYGLGIYFFVYILDKILLFISDVQVSIVSVVGFLVFMLVFIMLIGNFGKRSYEFWHNKNSTESK